MVLAGWGTQDDDAKTPYWLVKNSWSTAWNAGGPQGGGYFKILRGSNTAGVEGSVCLIGPKTDKLVSHSKYNPRAHWTLPACGFGNNDDSLFDYDDYTGAWIFTANYCLALLSSFGVYTLVEKPFANLTMMLLAPPRKKQ